MSNLTPLIPSTVEVEGNHYTWDSLSTKARQSYQQWQQACHKEHELEARLAIYRTARYQYWMAFKASVKPYVRWHFLPRLRAEQWREQHKRELRLTDDVSDKGCPLGATLAVYMLGVGVVGIATVNAPGKAAWVTTVKRVSHALRLHALPDDIAAAKQADMPLSPNQLARLESLLNVE
ncbi:hypothetical protein QC823_11230 [Halomonas vilamensis]|uniref:Uncharacterized protein n=1 Tax=Vreelandella vilamensis TaxID=531309 RepID=A0ABU1H6Q1_9GAMM|nr:hypothetical protein [Halomonas vilamensis]MDR5899556.1 hypothetical protein [Halomonas vilamensis]